ncbi:MAG: glycosyltransferase, partial [Clostridium sp.]|nr:glycosyltransferase [Clostridium sp.]
YMNIEILRKPSNTGCGQSRQYGIDHCRCEYFMFLDTDDCLYFPGSVKQMISVMERDGLDSLYTDFMEERGNGQYRLQKQGGGWMHGKMFRTKYIQENHIRFNETRLHEDHAFNIVQLYSGGKNGTADIVTYLWKCYEKSLTRCPAIRDDYRYSMENYMVNANYTVAQLCMRNVEADIIRDIIRKYIVSFYRHLNIMTVQGNSQENLEEVLAGIIHFWENIPSEIRNGLSESYLTQRFYQSGGMRELIDRNIVPALTFHQFYTFLET